MGGGGRGVHCVALTPSLRLLLDPQAATWMLEKLQMSRLAHGDSLASEEEDEEVQKNIIPYAEFQRMFAEFQVRAGGGQQS